VSGDCSSTRGLIREDEHSSNRQWLPTKPLANDARPQTNLGVMPADRLLDARDLGLDLVDDGDPPVREYCQEVDRATFAPFGERDFRGESPAGGCERAGGSLDQLSVSCVGQPVEVTTTPADNSLEPCVEQGEDAADDFNGESRQMPALEAGNSGLVTTGGSRQVELAPAASAAQGATQPPDPQVVHRAMVSNTPHPARI